MVMLSPLAAAPLRSRSAACLCTSASTTSSRCCNVQHCDRVNYRDATSQTVHITFETPEQALLVINEMDGVHGRRGRQGDDNSREYPLRLLVRSDMLGKIADWLITARSGVLIDFSSNDYEQSLERALNIFGSPEDCTEACEKILKIMHEANNYKTWPKPLKILAHNAVIGRIIGSGGHNIRRITRETETIIGFSGLNADERFYMQQVITVKGTIRDMARAESLIYANLRQTYRNDQQGLNRLRIKFPGVHPMAMMKTGLGVYYTACPPAHEIAQHGTVDSQETAFLSVPFFAVGAIMAMNEPQIGDIGFSGASVSQVPSENQSQYNGPIPCSKIMVVGSPEEQWQAQYLIFEKIREECFVSVSEDVRLTVEIAVASSQVGRIIGKGGQNVRKLQRVTGSRIKRLVQPRAGASDTDTTVHITGHFYNVQSAQRKIREIVAQASPRTYLQTRAESAAFRVHAGQQW